MSEYVGISTTASLEMLDELLDDESDSMSDWELEFIESLDRQRGRAPLWSQKQLKVLVRVWDKVFG